MEIKIAVFLLCTLMFSIQTILAQAEEEPVASSGGATPATTASPASSATPTMPASPATPTSAEAATATPTTTANGPRELADSRYNYRDLAYQARQATIKQVKVLKDELLKMRTDFVDTRTSIRQARFNKVDLDEYARTSTPRPSK